MKAREIIALKSCQRWEGCAWSEIGERAKIDYLEDADAIIAALDAAGFVIVPREPTKAMLDAFYKKVKSDHP